MLTCNTLIRNATPLDGRSAEPEIADLAVRGDCICGGIRPTAF